MKKKTTLSLSGEELEMLYNAVNRLAIHYGDKSEMLQDIIRNQKDGTPITVTKQDYYYKMWRKAGNLNSKIYKAQKRINAE